MCISLPSSFVFNPEVWVTAFGSDPSLLAAQIPELAAGMCVDVTDEAKLQILGQHAVGSCQDHPECDQGPSAKVLLAKLLQSTLVDRNQLTQVESPLRFDSVNSDSLYSHHRRKLRRKIDHS